MRNLLEDIGLKQTDATMIDEDNQGAIALSRNPKHHPRAKHIDVKYHYIRETIERGSIALSYCPTADMVADVMMKGFSVLRNFVHQWVSLMWMS